MPRDAKQHALDRVDEALRTVRWDVAGQVLYCAADTQIIDGALEALVDYAVAHGVDRDTFMRIADERMGRKVKT